eukprot:m.48182 g.48182  ORF g.48182 m.48182 type:complete len:316 (+) comp20682_c0_seq1:103-1050(+)
MSTTDHPQRIRHSTPDVGLMPDALFDASKTDRAIITVVPSSTSSSNSNIPTIKVKNRHKYNPFCIMQRDPQHPDQYLITDTEIIGSSIYVFLLGFCPLGWLFSICSAGVQIVGMLTFWYAAQKPDKNFFKTTNTDYTFGVPTCFPTDKSDAENFPDSIWPLPEVVKPVGVELGKNVTAYVPFCDYDDASAIVEGESITFVQKYCAFVMLVILFMPGVAKGIQLLFRGRRRWLVAICMLFTPIATLVISYIYILATARTPTTVLVSVFVVSFINDFDENTFTALDALFPVYTKVTVDRLSGKGVLSKRKNLDVAEI